MSSYAAGVPTTYDFPSVALTRILDDAAAIFPTVPALAFLGRTITYREVKEEVDRFAAGLAGLGVTHGDRVALVLPNCPQFVIAFFATLRLGAVVVPTNPLASPADMLHQLTDARPKVVVCLDKIYPAVTDLRTQVGIETVVVTSLADYLPRSQRLRLALPIPAARRRRADISAPVAAGHGVTTMRALIKGAVTPAAQVPVDAAADTAVLAYTSGTTGPSRGAMLSHANLVANAYQLRLWRPDAVMGKEVTLGVLPLFHSYGMSLCMTTTMLFGGTLVLLPRFDLGDVLAAVDTYGPTLLPGVPLIYRAILDAPHRELHDLRSIRACVSGAMALPPDLQRRFEEVTGGRLIAGYGLSEASPVTHAQPLDGSAPAGTAGLPLTGTEARVVNPAAPRVPLPAGSYGELLVRGPQVFLGYRHAPADAPAVDAEGWLHTGDLGSIDEDGYLTVLGRAVDAITLGPRTVHPGQIERVIAALPEVADVCVVGVGGEETAAVLKAYVVLAAGATLTAEQIGAHCDGILESFAVPRHIDLRASLPRTVLGKVLRRELVERESAAGPGPVWVPPSGPSVTDPPGAAPATATPAKATPPKATPPKATPPKATESKAAPRAAPPAQKVAEAKPVPSVRAPRSSPGGRVPGGARTTVVPPVAPVQAQGTSLPALPAKRRSTSSVPPPPGA